MAQKKIMTDLKVDGSLSQKTVLSSIVKADGSGNLIAAVPGTDYLTQNFYSGNGTLTSDRTVTGNSKNVRFENLASFYTSIDSTNYLVVNSFGFYYNKQNSYGANNMKFDNTGFGIYYTGASPSFGTFYFGSNGLSVNTNNSQINADNTNIYLGFSGGGQFTINSSGFNIADYSSGGSVNIYSGNKISMYGGTGGNTANIKTELLTSARTYQFPNNTGTLALLSDIPVNENLANADLYQTGDRNYYGGGYGLSFNGLNSYYTEVYDEYYIYAGNTMTSETDGNMVFNSGNYLTMNAGYSFAVTSPNIKLSSAGGAPMVLECATGVKFKTGGYGGVFYGSLTADRTYTLPNQSGTLALISDVHNIYNSNGMLLSNRTVNLNSYNLSFTASTFDTANLTYKFSLDGGISLLDSVNNKYNSISTYAPPGTYGSGFQLICGVISSDYGVSDKAMMRFSADDAGGYVAARIDFYNYDTNTYGGLSSRLADDGREWLLPNKSGILATLEDIPVSTSGTYTPTITGSETYTASKFTYIRVDNNVHVSGRVSVAVLGAGDHDFLISLPINSNITSDDDLIGVVSGDIRPSGFTSHQQKLIYGNTSSDEARVSFSTDEDRVIYVQFDYVIN